MADTRTHDLPFRRVAVTVPPDGWFQGISKSFFDIYRQGLVDLGLQVFDVPVEPFVSMDVVRIRSLLDALRAFGPDLAFGLPKGSYALLCRLRPGRDGWRPNLFTDVLDVPTICFWDHAPVELADQILPPGTAHPNASAAGAMGILRRVLTHPRLIHWSRDDGQTRIMSDLGLLYPGRVVCEMPPTLPGFSDADAPAPPLRSGEPAIAFVGHLYQDADTYPHPDLAALADDVATTWTGSCERPIWDVLADRMSALSAQSRQQLALHPDQTAFWRFAHPLMLHHAQTRLRLQLLGGARQPVACYGNLRTDRPGVPPNLRPMPGGIPFGPPLARVLARHPVTIDVMNPGSIDGYSHKPLLAFSAGGFVLLNWKPHFVDAFGDAGAAVCYRSGDDLAAKVETFLSRPAYRHEVAGEMRARIAARFQLHDVLARVLHAAAGCVDAPAGAARSVPPAHGAEATVVRQDLLSSLQSPAQWGARVEHEASEVVVSTSGQPWGYGARVDVPHVRQMNEPHVQVDLIVESGRIGISAELDTGALVAEQTVGPTRHAISVVIELPHQGARSIILRNSTEAPSRARVLRLGLCDRTG